jgi:hypothetical protein
MEYLELASLAIIANPWIIYLLVWTLICKGLALWKAARNNSKTWFVVLLVVNTLGILDLLYYFVIGKRNK